MVPIPVKYHSKPHTVTQSIKFLSLRENVIAMQFSRTMKVTEKRITFQQTNAYQTIPVAVLSTLVISWQSKEKVGNPDPM